MLAIRIAVTDPDKQAERAEWLEAHKAHLRNASIRIVQSGPMFDGARQVGALVVAEVASLDELRRFSLADPFVAHGVYRNDPQILRWAPSIG